VKTQLAVLVLLFSTGIAEARSVNAKFLLDLLPGITVPIGPPGWVAEGDPSFKHSFRIGAELWFNRRFAFAGEGALDVSPQMFDRGDVHARVRAMVGFRLVFGLGVGAFFLRHAIGADYLATRISPPNGSASLAVEPGMGLQFRFSRYGVAGVVMDFPTSFSFGSSPNFNMDVQLLGLIGVRI
jgi:hypothetical protein